MPVGLVIEDTHLPPVSWLSTRRDIRMVVMQRNGFRIRYKGSLPGSWLDQWRHLGVLKLPRNLTEVSVPNATEELRVRLSRKAKELSDHDNYLWVFVKVMGEELQQKMY